MRSYGQFCALARALDHVGDRWTLLIIRELLISDAGYGDLQAALAGIPTNLLADRLRGLERDGLVTREAGGADRRRVTYRLTPLGRGLEPTVRELITWGAHWMRTGPGGDQFDTRWAGLALRALLAGHTAPVPGVVELHFDGAGLTVIATETGHVQVDGDESGGPADAVVTGAAGLLLAVASGQLSLNTAARRGLRVRGNRRLAATILEPPP